MNRKTQNKGIRFANQVTTYLVTISNEKCITGRIYFTIFPFFLLLPHKTTTKAHKENPRCIPTVSVSLLLLGRQCAATFRCAVLCLCQHTGVIQQDGQSRERSLMVHVQTCCTVGYFSLCFLVFIEAAAKTVRFDLLLSYLYLK